MARRVPYRATIAFFTALSVVLTGFGVAEASNVLPSQRPAAGSNTLTVTVGSAFTYVLSTDQVTPGATVTVTVVQTDDVEHTFTLSSVAEFAFTDANTTGDLQQFFAAHPPLVNVTVPAGQAQFSATFVAPPFGEYEYVCLVAGHFQAGMRGFLGSGEPGSSGPTSEPPGAAVFIIGGTIAGLVVLALVLGFVIGRRRGAHDEMPPERLGYPEPAGSGTPPTSPGHS
jgi:plastocyanin